MRLKKLSALLIVGVMSVSSSMFAFGSGTENSASNTYENEASFEGNFEDDISISPHLIIADGDHSATSTNLKAIFTVYKDSKVRVYITNNGTEDITITTGITGISATIAAGSSKEMTSTYTLLKGDYTLVGTNKNGSKKSIYFRANQLTD